MLAASFDCQIVDYSIRDIEAKSRQEVCDNVHHLPVTTSFSEVSVTALVENIFEPINIELLFSNYDVADPGLLELLQACQLSGEKIKVHTDLYSLIDGMITLYNPKIHLNEP